MTKNNNYIIIFFIIILLFFAFTNIVNAEEFVSDNYKITATYKIEDEAYSEKRINIYKIAEIDEQKNYSIAQEFEEYNFDLEAISTSTELDNLANLILGIIDNDEIEAFESGYTDENGIIIFDNLLPGVYLLESESLEEKDKIIEYTPALVQVPNSEGSYETKVNPKGTITELTYEEIEYKIIIYWDDQGKNRPQSVAVNIFKDGIKQETVSLSSKNNWTYTWNALDDGSEWTVLENELPENYTIRQEKGNNAFYITYIYVEPTSTPQTPSGGGSTPSIDNNPINPESPIKSVGTSNSKLPSSLEELNAILREKTKNKVKLPVTGEEKTVFIFLIIAILSIIGLIATNIVSKRLEKDK